MAAFATAFRPGRADATDRLEGPRESQACHNTVMVLSFSPFGGEPARKHPPGSTRREAKVQSVMKWFRGTIERARFRGQALVLKMLVPCLILSGSLVMLAPALAVQAADLTRQEVEAVLTANPDSPPDLSGKDLSGLDLSGLDFRVALMRGANLRGSDLSGAEMRGVELQGADLSGAKLAGANLDLAILRGAKLQGADLTDVSAVSTVLAGCDLTGANLSGARLVSNLERAKLVDANLAGAIMAADMKNQPMGLIRVSLMKADLTRANLEGANLSRGFMEFADFTDANLVGANLTRADAGGANFSGADLTGANFYKADIQDARFLGIKGRETIIDLDTALHLRSALFD
jgi:uncharacterized protein YjbI with pentapeptide repeats